jgi:hypothetical protein
LRVLIEDAFPSMQALVRAVLHLHGESAARPTEEVIDRAATLAGFSAAPIQAVLAHRRGTARLADSAVAGVVAGYLDELQTLVAFADAFGKQTRGSSEVGHSLAPEGV